MNAETTQSIVVDYELAQAPEKIWRALTDFETLARWLMPNDICPVLGHRFTFRSQPMPGWDGVVQCEVLEVEPMKRLSYSWRGGSEAMRLDTTVTWTLAPGKAGGTLLRLEHSGFTAKDQFAFDGLGKGWRGKVAERMESALGA
jgi:uncharacterized protein YndB with AHSA1/START domain